MNNIDKVTELQRIISTAQDDLAELMKKGKRFKPVDGQVFYAINAKVEVGLFYNNDTDFDKACYDNFNCYETEELATKAAVMMKRKNAIIMACLQVDPDFVPDYLSGNQEHYSFGHEAPQNGYKCGWIIKGTYHINNGPCVSTEAKWHEAAALLTEWGIE
jgi:hypothetical protein